MNTETYYIIVVKHLNGTICTVDKDGIVGRDIFRQHEMHDMVLKTRATWIDAEVKAVPLTLEMVELAIEQGLAAKDWEMRCCAYEREMAELVIDLMKGQF